MNIQPNQDKNSQSLNAATDKTPLQNTCNNQPIATQTDSNNSSGLQHGDTTKDGVNKTNSCRNLWQKIKTMKNYQIFVALVIAAVVILIYFSVNAITTKPSGDTMLSKAEQSQLEQVLSQINGVGYCNVIITYEVEGEVKQSNEIENNAKVFGVVVVAEGGDDTYVKIKITDALCALLDIKGNNIKIYKSK